MPLSPAIAQGARGPQFAGVSEHPTASQGISVVESSSASCAPGASRGTWATGAAPGTTCVAFRIAQRISGGRNVWTRAERDGSSKSPGNESFHLLACRCSYARSSAANWIQSPNRLSDYHPPITPTIGCKDSTWTLLSLSFGVLFNGSIAMLIPYCSS